MAKDILKEAIADAKAVREVALANAKAALEEAFTPKIQSMLSAKLSEELEEDMTYDEDENDVEEELDLNSMLDEDEDEDMDEMMTYDEDEDMDEMMTYDEDEKDMDEMMTYDEDESMDEEIDLEEILNELELEGDETNEDEEQLDEMGKPIYKAEYTGTNHHYTADKVMESEEFDLDALLKEINNLDEEKQQLNELWWVKLICAGLAWGLTELFDHYEWLPPGGGGGMVRPGGGGIEPDGHMKAASKIGLSPEQVDRLLAWAERNPQKVDACSSGGRMTMADVAEIRDIVPILVTNSGAGSPDMGSRAPMGRDMMMEGSEPINEQLFAALGGLAGLLGAAGVVTAVEMALEDPAIKEKYPKLVKVFEFLQKIGGALGSGIKQEDMTYDEDESDKSEELEETKKALKAVKSELNEVNLLNSKLLYVNRIFKANSLDDGQKLRVVETLDKAGSIKEAKLIYETIKDTFNVANTKKASVRKNQTRTIKENFGMASKAAGIYKAPKKEIISESNNMISRFQKLANIQINE